jgi:hypothetical protein
VAAPDLPAPDLAPPAVTDPIVATAGNASDVPLVTEPSTHSIAPADVTTPSSPDPSGDLSIVPPVDDVTAAVSAPLSHLGAVAPVDDVMPAVTAPSLPDPLSDVSTVPPVDGVMSTVSDTAGAVSPLTDTLSDPGLVAPVHDVMTAVSDTAATASSLTDTLSDPGLVAPLDDVTSAVSATLGDPGLVAPVDGLVGRVADSVVVPFTTSVATVPAGLADSVDAVITPFTTTIGESAGALVGTGPLAGLGDPFAVTVAPSGSAGPAPFDAAGGPTSMDGASASDTASQQSLADGAATTAAPAAVGTAAPDPGPLAHQGGLGVDGTGLPGVANDLGSLAAGHVSGPFAGAPSVSAAPVDVAPLDAPPISGADASALPVAPPGVDSDSVLGIVTQVGQDTRIVAAAAVMTFAAVAVIGPRAGSSGVDARMAFTNVRLLPCLLKEAAGRQLTAITEGLAPAAAPAYAALSDRAAAVGTGGPAIRDMAAVKAEHAVGSVPRIVTELTEGFGRATRQATDEAAHGLSDSRLVVQIGMLLGIVYLTFLSVWFWATRARPGARA